MSLNNNLLRGKGLIQQDDKTRPVENDPAAARHNYIKEETIKQSALPSGKCPDGTRWHSKLMQCIPEENINLLRKRKGQERTEHQQQKRSSIKEALIRYGKTDRI